MRTPTSDRIEIPAAGVKTLCWQGDMLIDFLGGYRIFHLDGSIEARHVGWAYRFDAATLSPSGRYAVIYERLGTKGLLLDQGKLRRELNRSFYHANVYEYPIILFPLPSGREVVAHCPDAYSRIEIEDAETGERLTPPPTEKPVDFFHSRLAATADGRWLMSAGWIWHPVDSVCLFDVSRFLTEPGYHDSTGNAFPRFEAELSSAVFQGTDRVILTSSTESLDDEEPEDGTVRMQPSSIGVYDLFQRRMVHVAPLEETSGTLMPVDDDHVIGFYKHPKLIHIPTGRVLQRWEDLMTGEQSSSIIRDIPPLPPLALDPARRRFAVADKEKITVVTLQRQS